MRNLIIVAIFGIGLALLASNAMAQHSVLGDSVVLTESNTTTQETETTTTTESLDLLLRVKAGIEGAISTSTSSMASFWMLKTGVEIPVIWRETSIFAELGMGFWRPDSSPSAHATPLAGSASFFGAYYPEDWIGLRAGLKGYLFEGRYLEDPMIAQLNIQGDILLNFDSNIGILVGISGAVMGSGYRNKDVKRLLAPAWYLHAGFELSFDIFSPSSPD